MRKICIRLASLTIALFLSSCGDPKLVLDGTYSVYGATEIKAGMSFPPFANSFQINFTARELKALAIDRIRIAVDWRNRQPEQETFYWDPMDERMTAAQENNISVFLTIASVCPDWACLAPGSDNANLFDEDAFRIFVETLLTRYPNIDKIQFGNEWETGLEDGTAYTDNSSIEKFVSYTNILYDVVQSLSPGTQVVLGGLTRTFPIVAYFVDNETYPDFSGIDLAFFMTEDLLKARIDKIKTAYDEKKIKQNIAYVFENARYDMLDIHLYDDPENWSAYLSVLPQDKPIVVSEFGGPNSEFENTSPYYHAERMDDYIDAIEDLPVIEAYYFKLVESDESYHQDSGLFYSSLIMKPARNVFAQRLTPME